MFRAIIIEHDPLSPTSLALYPGRFCLEVRLPLTVCFILPWKSKLQVTKRGAGPENKVNYWLWSSEPFSEKLNCNSQDMTELQIDQGSGYDWEGLAKVVCKAISSWVGCDVRQNWSQSLTVFHHTWSDRHAKEIRLTKATPVSVVTSEKEACLYTYLKGCPPLSLVNMFGIPTMGASSWDYHQKSKQVA